MLSADETRRRAYLQALGVTLWLPRPTFEQAASVNRNPEDAVLLAQQSRVEPDHLAEPKQDVEAPAFAQSDDTIQGSPEVDPLNWPQLKQAVSACQACALHQSRKQTVFGVGDQNADVLIIGEAPGAEEDAQGQPFVGRAGQLLNAMLKAIGFAREQVYIANILKCRPPGNRNPTRDEAFACRGFLQRQIELIDPKVVLAVGKIAAHNLLESDEAVSRLRGKVHWYRQKPLVVTYHPAYLLRQPAEKAKAWQDLQFLHAFLEKA